MPICPPQIRTENLGFRSIYGKNKDEKGWTEEEVSLPAMITHLDDV